VSGDARNILRALLIQPRLCWQDPDENRAQLEAQIDRALHETDGADLIIVPETFTTGFLGDADREPESMDGDTVAWMADVARRRNAAITGSVVMGEDGARFNRMLFVTPEGDIHHYDKRHLFAYGGEHKRYKAGTRRVVVRYRGWRICLQVCYDLRFPAWCRNQGDYDLMLFVANWPAKRITAWTALLMARAIENQAYVIGVNRVGEDGNGIAYPGQSAAFDALGEELASLGDDVASVIVELDLAALKDVRDELPFLADADRFEIWGHEIWGQNKN